MIAADVTFSASTMQRALAAWAVLTACVPDPAGAPDPRPAAAGASAPPAAHRPISPLSTPVDMQDEARAVMQSRCGLCHLPEGSEQPRALGVFDLAEDDWSAGLSDEQLVDIEARLVDGGASFEEVDAVRSYLGAARERRLQPPAQEC
jgi:mono/diheme cytochrome c family protein